MNPFITGKSPFGGYLQIIDAQGRLMAVKGFTLEQCREALKVEGLQKAVRTAIERRIRKLEKA